LGRYLAVYVQLFHEHVVYPYALVTRTPGAPLVVGALLELGPVAAELGAAVLYALSILAWCAVARRFGIAAAVVTAVALLTYPGYVLLFHQLSSDAVFAAAYALFALLLARAIGRPTAGRAAALGAGVALLVLVRPVAQALLLVVLVPLLAADGWRGRMRATGAFAAAAVLPLLLWATHNLVRADDFTVARGGGASIPFFRAFVADRIVEPENGPASRELARAVARGLLRHEPYRSYGIDLDTFFSAGSARMHEDLIGLSDRTWGWDDDYRHLARVGREAVLAHPWTYVRGVLGDTRDLLVWPLYTPIVDDGDSSSDGAPGPAPTVEIDGRTLPEPSEGEPIPAARVSAYISTPDGRIREVWTSPSEHHIVFRYPADEARAAQVDERSTALYAGFPDRGQRPSLVRWLNSASRWFPRPIVWLVVGLVGLALRRPRCAATPLVLAGTALLVLIATSLAVYATAEYAVPVVPAFVLLAAAGLFGIRSRVEP
jgi:hypothetical protein